MNKYTFERPLKRKGSVQTMMTLYVEPEFRKALNEFAATQSLNSGIKVSMSNVVQTSLKQRYPEIARRVTQLKREKSNERKYINQFKGEG